MWVGKMRKRRRSVNEEMKEERGGCQHQPGKSMNDVKADMSREEKRTMEADRTEGWTEDRGQCKRKERVVQWIM